MLVIKALVMLKRVCEISKARKNVAKKLSFKVKARKLIGKLLV